MVLLIIIAHTWCITDTHSIVCVIIVEAEPEAAIIIVGTWHVSCASLCFPGMMAPIDYTYHRYTVSSTRQIISYNASLSITSNVATQGRPRRSFIECVSILADSIWLIVAIEEWCTDYSSGWCTKWWRESIGCIQKASSRLYTRCNPLSLLPTMLAVMWYMLLCVISNLWYCKNWLKW